LQRCCRKAVKQGTSDMFTLFRHWQWDDEWIAGRLGCRSSTFSHRCDSAITAIQLAREGLEKAPRWAESRCSPQTVPRQENVGCRLLPLFRRLFRPPDAQRTRAFIDNRPARRYTKFPHFCLSYRGQGMIAAGCGSCCHTRRQIPLRFGLSAVLSLIFQLQLQRRCHSTPPFSVMRATPDGLFCSDWPGICVQRSSVLDGIAMSFFFHRNG
jgi:hypothetical protein